MCSVRRRSRLTRGWRALVAYAKWTWDEENSLTTGRIAIPLVLVGGVVGVVHGVLALNPRGIFGGLAFLGIALFMLAASGGVNYWWTMWRHGHPPE